MRTLRLLRIELTVAELTRAERFYVEALGFESLARDDLAADAAALLGAERVRQVTLRRGGQTLVLQAFRPPGDGYPANAIACDQVFQHFALPVPDMAAAYARLLPFTPTPISHFGPQTLPQRSGGAVAFKFRDPDGHPLELIQFPDRHAGGIDHSAIAVADVERSIGFYRDQLGLRVASRQTNTGVEQDRLDGLHQATVDVIGLAPEQATPHVELLGYRAPAGNPAPPSRPGDVAATRLVLEVAELPHTAATLVGGRWTRLLSDPDGHMLMLVKPGG